LLIQGKYLNYGDDLSPVFDIRKKVFVEEQKVSEEEEFDEIDKIAVHAIVFDTNHKDKPVATGRVYHDGESYRVGRVAVLKEARGMYYGDFVVRLLLNKAFLSGAKEVIISAQVKAIPFYEKIGFAPFGDIYFEAGIEHVKMKISSTNICRKCDKK
jgi:predicted GNAT family N-acyltransferase